MNNGKDRDCRTCGAPLKFVRIRKKDGELGRRVPVSLDSREKRLVMIEDESGEIRARQTTTFVSHFADCPDADEHRRSD